MATPSTNRSGRMFEKAQQLMPGGVSSPVRAFGSVGGTPRFFERGQGPFVWDIDSNRYVDYVLSWGPLILGHSHPSVVEAICVQAGKGATFGAPTVVENTLAEMVIEAVPSIEMVRFVSSGTEATMSAIRLARAYTKREKIIKFNGCYHGHADAFLVQAGSGVATLGLPNSPGVVAATTADTLTSPYNDIDAVEALFKQHNSQIAAIVVEPVAGNMGLVLPQEGFLEGLRRICSEHDSLLIFDEVMTGFRVAYGGAQAFYNVMPDLTCLGKVLGGGLPAAAYGGRRDIMNMVAPAGPMYQAGTLSGNPLAMAAGIATLEELKRSGTYGHLSGITSTLCQGLWKAAFKAKIPFQAHKIGGMWGFFFAEEQVNNFEDAKKANSEHFKQFYHGMLDRNMYLAPSPFEAAFVSTAHDEDVMVLTLQAAQDTFAQMAKNL